jgi:hypothetical protein
MVRAWLGNTRDARRPTVKKLHQEIELRETAERWHTGGSLALLTAFRIEIFGGYGYSDVSFGPGFTLESDWSSKSISDESWGPTP